jgi:hypothetical protein
VPDKVEIARRHDGQETVRSFALDIAAGEVLAGRAAFANPSAETDHALELARDRRARRLADAADASHSRVVADFMKGSDHLSQAKAFSYAMRDRKAR